MNAALLFFQFHNFPDAAAISLVPFRDVPERFQAGFIRNGLLFCITQVFIQCGDGHVCFFQIIFFRFDIFFQFGKALICLFELLLQLLHFFFLSRLVRFRPFQFFRQFFPALCHLLHQGFQTFSSGIDRTLGIDQFDQSLFVLFDLLTHFFAAVLDH